MKTQRSPIFRNGPCRADALPVRSQELMAFLREEGPRHPDFMREMLKSADDRAAFRKLWECRLVGVVKDASGQELWGVLPGPQRGRTRRLDLGGAKPLTAAERAYVRRLHYLVDAIVLTMDGVPVTLDVIRERIDPGISVRQAERHIADIMDVSKGLGYPLRRQPFEIVGEDVVFVDTPGYESGRWALRFRSPEKLLGKVQREIEKYVPKDTTKTTEDYALEYARRKEAGVCVHCRRFPPEPGRVSCAECLKEARDRIRSRVEAGLCPECRDPVDEPGFSSCSKCRAAHRRLERDRRAQGLCPQCGERAAEGRAYCIVHAELDSEYHAERYRRLKSIGLCRCKKPLEPGRATCIECRKINEAAEEARVSERRAKGLCLKCGSPVVPGLLVCERHREAIKADSRSKREKLRAAGLCRTCRQPWSGKQIDCEACREKFAAAKAARAAQGVCSNCRVGKRVEGQTRCKQCIDDAKARYDSLKAQGICVTCKRRKVDKPGEDTICATCRARTRERYQAKQRAKRGDQS